MSEENQSESQDSKSLRLAPFLMTFACLALLAGLLLDGYVLGRRFLVVMLPIAACYIPVVLKTQLSLRTSRLLGIIIPSVVFGVLTLL